MDNWMEEAKWSIITLGGEGGSGVELGGVGGIGVKPNCKFPGSHTRHQLYCSSRARFILIPFAPFTDPSTSVDKSKSAVPSSLRLF